LTFLKLSLFLTIVTASGTQQQNLIRLHYYSPFFHRIDLTINAVVFLYFFIKIEKSVV